MLSTRIDTDTDTDTGTSTGADASTDASIVRSSWTTKTEVGGGGDGDEGKRECERMTTGQLLRWLLSRALRPYLLMLGR